MSGLAKSANKTAGWRGISAILLAAALIARLFVGPAFAEPPSPGLVPLCLGGVLVYVPLDGYDGPVLDEGGDETVTDPCPWLWLGAAKPSDEAAVLLQPSLDLCQAVASDVAPATGAKRAYSARGPPVLGA
ncbi:MAG: hypothetical protein AAGC57_09130 [Pseudomonadota bacterium]